MSVMAYKIELLIIDHDGLGADAINDVLENTKYPNHCISPEVKDTHGIDVGEWTDEHPLNQNNTSHAEYERLFK